MKIAHIIKDEKFPDSAYEFFEAVVPGQSNYYLPGKKRIHHLEKIIPRRCSGLAFFSRKFIDEINSHDAVVFHSLDRFAIEVLARIRKNIVTVWIGMGYDYYDLISGERGNLLKPLTKKVSSKKSKMLRLSPVHLLKSVLLRFASLNHSKKKQLVKRINIFSPVLAQEHRVIHEIMGDPFPEYVKWNYGRIVDLVEGGFGDIKVKGVDILIGNSAAPTNNHLDTFELLLKIGLPEDARLIVPLSYGDQSYRDKVIAAGVEKFGDRFVPITDFLSMEEYVQLLSNCSSVIMNHLRQQAAGNIFIAYLLGAKVYLDPSNLLFDELNGMGLAVGDLNSLTREQLKNDQVFDKDFFHKQRDSVREQKNRSAFVSQTENLISRIKIMSSELKMADGE